MILPSAAGPAFSWSCRNATSSIPGKDAPRRKRRIDGFVLFFFESRDRGDGFQGSTRD
jgi:hypothetical protein